MSKLSAAIDKGFDTLAVMHLCEVTARQLADDLGNGSGDSVAAIAQTLEMALSMVRDIVSELQNAEATLENARKQGRVA